LTHSALTAIILVKAYQSTIKGCDLMDPIDHVDDNFGLFCQILVDVAL
jgi:hypothetical protein